MSGRIVIHPLRIAAGKLYLNKHLPNYPGGFVRLTDFKGAKHQGPKALEIIQAARKVGK